MPSEINFERKHSITKDFQLKDTHTHRERKKKSETEREREREIEREKERERTDWTLSIQNFIFYTV